MPDTQKSARIVTRQALRELEGHQFSGDAKVLLASARKYVRDAPKPWPLETVQECLMALREASRQMGDVSIWNQGGQGYRAVEKLRAWEKSCKPFVVELRTLADVKTSTAVSAPDEETATLLATYRAEGGDVVWEYCGVVDDPRIEVSNVRSG